MSILEALKAQTREPHRRLERRLEPCWRAGTLEDYVALLVRFYGFVEPLERDLEGLAGLADAGLDLERRRKGPLLARDLAALGRSELLASGPSCCRMRPRPACPAEGLGQMYVFEGATLGGRILSAHFARALGVTPARGGAYFHGYGAETDAMWEAFREALVAYEARFGGAERMLDAACQTFQALEEWFTRTEARLP